MRPNLRRGVVLVLGAALMVAVYVGNSLTPPAVKLGLFYLVPILLVAWHEGVLWSSAFTVVALYLRMIVELEQQTPYTTVMVTLLNQLSFAAVAGIAIFAFRSLHRNQLLLRDLATHDPLTRVLNTRTFQDRLTQELGRNRRYNRPMALLYLDLDDFKVVNDTHGHNTGDAVLRLVADAIRGAVRQTDVVGRLGGDEFAVLMPETDGPVAEAAAQRLASSLATVFDGTPPVTASVGLLSCTGTDADTDAVLRRVDQAMYEAKRTGKNRVVRVAL